MILIEPHVPSGVRQIVDTGENINPVPAGATAGVTVLGTKWPLLPKQTIKVFNVSLEFIPSVSAVFICYSLNLFLNFLDAQGNSILISNSVFQPTVSLSLATWNSGAGGVPAPNMANQNGFGLSNEGDPLIEVVSNLLIASVAVTGSGIAMVQLQGSADVKNTDVVARNVDGILNALLAFEV